MENASVSLDLQFAFVIQDGEEQTVISASPIGLVPIKVTMPATSPMNAYVTLESLCAIILL